MVFGQGGSYIGIWRGGFAGGFAPLGLLLVSDSAIWGRVHASICDALRFGRKTSGKCRGTDRRGKGQTRYAAHGGDRSGCTIKIVVGSYQLVVISLAEKGVLA